MQNGVTQGAKEQPNGPNPEMESLPGPQFTLSLLGRVQLTGPGGPVDLPNKKLAGLLAYLACTAPARSRARNCRPCSGDRISMPRPSRTCARRCSACVSSSGQDALQSDGEACGLNAGALSCDVADSNRWCRTAAATR